MLAPDSLPFSLHNLISPVKRNHLPVSEDLQLSCLPPLSPSMPVLSPVPTDGSTSGPRRSQPQHTCSPAPANQRYYFIPDTVKSETVNTTISHLISIRPRPAV